MENLSKSQGRSAVHSVTQCAAHVDRDKTIVAHLLSPPFCATLFLASFPSKCSRRCCCGAPLLPPSTLPHPPAPPLLSPLLHSLSSCRIRLRLRALQAFQVSVCALVPPPFLFLPLLPSHPFFLPISPFSSPPSPLLLLSFLSSPPSSLCFDRLHPAAQPVLSVPSLKCVRTPAARAHPPSFSQSSRSRLRRSLLSFLLAPRASGAYALLRSLMR